MLGLGRFMGRGWAEYEYRDVALCVGDILVRVLLGTVEMHLQYPFDFIRHSPRALLLFAA